MKIAIFGKTHPQDYPNNWDVRICPPLEDVAQAAKTGDYATLDTIIGRLAGVDVAIYSLLGADLNNIMPVLTEHDVAKKVFAVKRRALWTVDSHHWAGQEHEWAKHFTSVYSSHPDRLGIKSYYLPPAVCDISSKMLADLPFSDTPPTISVSCLMRPYWGPKTTRHASLQKLIPIFKKYCVSYLFGQAEPFATYIMLLRNSQVVLNLSLDG